MTRTDQEKTFVQVIDKYSREGGDEIVTNHAYAVIGADNRFIYIKNPANEYDEETLKVPIKHYKSLFMATQIKDLP